MMEASTRAVVTAVAAAAIALAAVSGPLALGVVVAVLAVVFALGWPRLIELPTFRGASVVVILVALAALGLVPTRSGTLLAVLMGLAVVAAFVHQMLRRDGRPRLVESVSGVVAGAVVVISAAGWVVVEATRSAEALVVAGTAAIAGAAGATVVPRPTQWVAVLATITGGVVGLVAGLLLPEVGFGPGLFVGLAVGILTSAMHVLFGRFPASRRARPALSAALLPLLVMGMPVSLAGSLLLR